MAGLAGSEANVSAFPPLKLARNVVLQPLSVFIMLVGSPVANGWVKLVRVKRCPKGALRMKLSAKVPGYRSENRPTPPRNTVFFLPIGLQAKPKRGWKTTFSRLRTNVFWCVDIMSAQDNPLLCGV